MVLVVVIHFILSIANAQSATLTIHGETHDTPLCVDQRITLAKQAASGTGLFFTENASTPEWTDAWSIQRAKRLLQNVQISPRVQGLESPNSWVAGVYFRNKSLFDRKRADALRIGDSPRSRRKQFDRQVQLIGARGWLDNFLSDNGVYESEPLRSVFCRGIQYDSKSVYSYSDQTLFEFISGPAETLMERLESSALDEISRYSDELGVSRSVKDSRERRWVSDVDSKFSRGEIDYLIIWRNYVMQKNLEIALDRMSPPLIDEDVHIILGASHVRHFYKTLLRDYPQLVSRYQIQVNFDCMSEDHRNHYIRKFRSGR